MTEGLRARLGSSALGAPGEPKGGCTMGPESAVLPNTFTKKSFSDTDVTVIEPDESQRSLNSSLSTVKRESVGRSGDCAMFSRASYTDTTFCADRCNDRRNILTSPTEQASVNECSNALADGGRWGEDGSDSLVSPLPKSFFIGELRVSTNFLNVLSSLAETEISTTKETNDSKNKTSPSSERS